MCWQLGTMLQDKDQLLTTSFTKRSLLQSYNLGNNKFLPILATKAYRDYNISARILTKFQVSEDGIQNHQAQNGLGAP